ncbi:DUF6524 family protein [Psychromarinibacter halotolerans]|uniref:DUF6524 family protein n=1 Tax=Psychromarinibacter halotolerans TaxID=1775175 RepID=A0ABV7GQ73_9RHOB|nr:DUF6524 family protein [Psychromarinibacter halotolerans]MAQ83496.1 hypothetical protein [Maritimibacter sp.]MDF0594679.1 DUF6524 family protein [Psychromarinibacter halotolerans]
MALLIRWIFAFVLVIVTYNPTPWNYTRWALDTYETRLSIVVLAGLVLLVGYIIFLRATLRSIGLFGVVLILALLGAIVWVLLDMGWLSVENPDAMVWLGIIAVSAVMGIGLSWSIIRRRLSGQLDVDDIEE